MVGEWDGWLALIYYMISSLFPLQQSSLKSPSFRVFQRWGALPRHSRLDALSRLLPWPAAVVKHLGAMMPRSWMAMDKLWMPAMRIYHHLPELDIFRSFSSRIFPAIHINFYRICQPAMFDKCLMTPYTRYLELHVGEISSARITRAECPVISGRMLPFMLFESVSWLGRMRMLHA